MLDTRPPAAREHRAWHAPAGRPAGRTFLPFAACARTHFPTPTLRLRVERPNPVHTFRSGDSNESAPSSAGRQPLPTCIDRARHPYDDTPEKVRKKTRTVIRLPVQVISTVVESVFPVSLRRPRRAGGRPGRAGPDRTSPCGRAAAGRDRWPGFCTRPAPRRRHATGGRASARERAGSRQATGGHASAHDRVVLRHATRLGHATGPGFGTPLPQLIPRRRVGLGRFFTTFQKLAKRRARSLGVLERDVVTPRASNFVVFLDSQN